MEAVGEPGAVGRGMVGDRDWPVASGGYERWLTGGVRLACLSGGRVRISCGIGPSDFSYRIDPVF